MSKPFAVCPGSYDPITRGHADLILRAAAIFGSCRVLVMNNAEKTYRFTPEERLGLARAAFREDPRITVEYAEGMLYEYLLQNPGGVLVKGIRNEEDWRYEKAMAEFNRSHCGAETLYLDASEEYRRVSSTLARAALDRREDLSSLLPKGTWEELQKKIVNIL